jgi:putative spermidine/putrescine transport system ATP-binding protein
MEPDSSRKGSLVEQVEVAIENLTKIFDSQVRAVDGVNLQIRKGELIALLGPSGCGKTTILRSVAGFVMPTAGHIRIRGEDITYTPPHKRNTALVFQNYALFPHLTVAQNIAFGLQMHKVPKREIPKHITAVLNLVQLKGMEDRYPHQLSGGQQQRVALARALVVNPDVLLLDEPLSNLDAKLRLDMRLEIRELVKQSGATAIYVTHDQEEALSIADRVVVMQHGRIQQEGSPRMVYETPQRLFVATFIGSANIFPGKVQRVERDTYHFVTEKGLALSAMGWPAAHQPGESAYVLIRPEHIRLLPAGEPALAVGHIRALTYIGAHTHYLITLATGEIVKVVTPSGSVSFQVGDSVGLIWDETRVRLVSPDE